MHRHLKYGLDFGGFEILPEDSVEDATDSDHGIQQRAAKRRRVEIIAGRCLKGNPPILLSTRLKGPFDNNWKNPWIERPETNKTTEPPTSMEVTKRTLSKKKRISTKYQPRGKNRSTRSRVSLQKPKGKVKNPSRISSPERPRGATSKSDGSIQLDPTRTLSDGDDSSVATEFFSAQTIQHQHHELPQKDTQWLRRPAKESRIRFGQRTDGISDISPSRSRDSHRPLGARGELQLALPKVPVGATESSGANTDIPDSWGTGASASMVISSPMQPTRATVDQPDSCTVMRQETVSSPSKTYHSAMPTQASSTVFVYRKIAGSKSKTNNAQKRKPRTMTFSSSPTLIRTTHKIPKEVQEVKARLEEVEEGQHNIQINIVATGETLVQQTPIHEVNGTLGNKEEAQKPASPSPLRSNVDQVKPQGPPGSSPAKAAVEYSTQAAMLMAQQEFQEGTFPSTFSATLQLCPEIEEHATLSNSSAPSAAMTPASGLRSGPDKSAPPESMLRGPPISTQDLFTAASPFAFSTLKKKRPERSQPSGLRLSLFSNEARDDDQDQEGNATATSPLSTIDRIPLKERNSKLSFRSTASAKASQSQESPYQAQSNSPSHVELPQLDFHTSLDKLSPDEDLAFTDQFLRNLNAII